MYPLRCNSVGSGPSRLGRRAVRFRTRLVQDRTVEPVSGRAGCCRIVRRKFLRDSGTQNLVGSPGTGCNSFGSAPLQRRISTEAKRLEGEWRPEPESNRRARICSPLRNHSAIGPRSRAFPRASACGQVGTGWRERKVPVRAALILGCITGI